MKNLLTVAINEIGIKEIKGNDHHQRILQYAKDSFFNWIVDDETAWCSIFLNWAAKQAGLETSKSAAARSWLHVGHEVNNPEPGDIVIFWREHINSHLGHVGIYLGFSIDHSRIYVLGGNQGDAVSISAYPTERVLSYRRLTSITTTSLPPVTLSKGEMGDKVVMLQNILKLLGYKPGTSDGIFGTKTKNSVKLLQTTNSSLTVTGIYNLETKNYLEELLANKN